MAELNEWLIKLVQAPTLVGWGLRLCELGFGIGCVGRAKLKEWRSNLVQVRGCV